MDFNVDQPPSSQNDARTNGRGTLSDSDGNREEDGLQLNPFSPGFSINQRDRPGTDTIMFNSPDPQYQYLELEQPSPQPLRVPRNDTDELLMMAMPRESQPTTRSGLRLTHRQTPQCQQKSTTSARTGNASTTWGNAEEENRYIYGQHMPESAAHQFLLKREQRLLRYSKVWVGLLATIVFIGSTFIWHSSHHEVTPSSRKQSAIPLTQQEEESAPRQTILLRPLPTNNATLTARKLTQIDENLHKVAKPDHHHNIIGDLRQEFEDWVQHHSRAYKTEHEKEKRFQIWTSNHHATVAKNDKHGPCKLTKKHVFGDNLFKDLTPQEFQSQYLTGYKGPRTDKVSGTKQDKTVLDAATKVERHHTVQKLYDQRHGRKLGYAASSSSCSWYDVSCWLRMFVNKYGYRIGGTMEPAYDPNTYASAIDWRDYGIVSDVKSQGNCGACWAITAVETIESSYAIYSGSLLDLADSEVIVCDDTCDLCEGGWPQNAFEYTMEHGGLPLANTWAYDGDTLLTLTYAKNGESDEGYTTDDFAQYVSDYCPADNSNEKRYANIKGYGYATDRCICYTDGTGCDCDEQNEKLALGNVATYGPAVVCLEASLWQDYAGGIITTELGCSSAFLDMNHCVQTVGYAYVDSSEEEGANDDESGSKSSDSNDDANREGYWIIRNQWSSSWGMNGYAYVAMGDNTCGVLNDMTIVYID